MVFGLFKKKNPVLMFKNIRLFGKLPGFADFVRYRSADPEAVHLDSWLTQGFSSLLNQGQLSVPDGQWNLSLCQESEKGYHLCTILNSQDKSGRQYPLVLLALVQVPWLKDHKASLPLLFRSLWNLGLELQDPKITTQGQLIESITSFEKKSWELSKGEVLERRITALKSLTQDQTWGAWLKNQAEIEPADWIHHQSLLLRKSNSIGVPLGSMSDAEEVTYWIQFLDDLRDLSEVPFHYYWLSSSINSKLVLQMGEFAMPVFQTLFEPCVMHKMSKGSHSELPYDGHMNLLASLEYWKRVS